MGHVQYMYLWRKWKQGVKCELMKDKIQPFLGGLFDLEARDTGLSFDADHWVLLCSYAVGEVNSRAVWQSHQELCRGEFNDDLYRWREKKRTFLKADRSQGEGVEQTRPKPSHLKLLPLAERKASLTVLLTPAASLVGVTHHSVFISVGIETRVDVHRDLLLVWANVYCKAVAERHSLTFNMSESARQR